MEDIECFHLFARSDELDGFLYDTAYTECGTATGIAVKFGKDDTVKVQAFVKRLGGIDSILTGHGINNEEYFLGRDSGFDGCNLGHHLLVDRQTSGGIDDKDIVAVGTCFAEGFACFLDRILFLFVGKDFGIDLFA